MISNEELIELARQRVEQHGSVEAYAKHIDISPLNLKFFLNGDRVATGRLLADLGYEKKTVFCKIGGDNSPFSR